MGGGSKAAAVYHRYGYRNGFLLHPAQRRGTKADCPVNFLHRLHHPGVDGHGADNAGHTHILLSNPSHNLPPSASFGLVERCLAAWSSIVLPARSSVVLRPGRALFCRPQVSPSIADTRRGFRRQPETLAGSFNSPPLLVERAGVRVKSCFPTALHPPGRRPHPNPPPEGAGTIKRPWQRVRLIFDNLAGQAIIVRRRLIAGLPGCPASPDACPSDAPGWRMQTRGVGYASVGSGLRGRP